MDIRKIKKLIELIKETGVAEIEIKEGEESVRICQHSMLPHPVQQITLSPTELQPAPAATPAIAAAPAAESHNGHVVKSPMVGTVYFAPAEGAKRYVEVGQSVEKGATLCLIEAMKMFNEIEADRAGVITRILVDNGQPVEFDQSLFIIE